MSDFKLILMDMDNTLTNAQREITPRTRAALRAASPQIRLGVCTGRAFPSVQALMGDSFAPENLHVVCGGGQVTTTTGDIKWGKLIPHQISQEITTKAQEFGAGFLLTNAGKIYVNDVMRGFFQARPDRAYPLLSFTELTDYSTPVMPIYGAPLEFYNYLNERDDVSYKQMQTYEHRNADITAKGVNKATGVQELCALLGISPTQVIGIGDSENDDEFLACVGYSVAMGNATEYLKKHAHRVIGETANEGLAEYLEKIAQGAEL